MLKSFTPNKCAVYLYPCPFCGSNCEFSPVEMDPAYKDKGWVTPLKPHYLKCSGCGAQVSKPSTDHTALSYLWNRRDEYFYKNSFLRRTLDRLRKVKQCPFCKHKAVIRLEDNRLNLSCRNHFCGISFSREKDFGMFGYIRTKKALIRLWNNRTRIAPDLVRIEKER